MKRLALTFVCLPIIACGGGNSASETNALDLSGAQSTGYQSTSQMEGTFSVTVPNYGAAVFQYFLSELTATSVRFKSNVVNVSGALQGRVSSDDVVLTKQGSEYTDGKIVVSIQGNQSRVVSYHGYQAVAVSDLNWNDPMNSQLGQISAEEIQRIEDLYRTNCPQMFAPGPADQQCQFEHNGQVYGGSVSNPTTDNSGWYLK